MGNRYATFRFLGSTAPEIIEIESEIELLSSDLLSLTQLTDAPQRDEIEPYLFSEPFIESESNAIVEAANNLRRATVEKTLEAIFDFVKRRISYWDYGQGEVGALTTLKKRRGVCTEYSELFIALCRALGIPARHNEGYVVFAGKELHAWPEAFVPTKGWVMFDPTFADNSPFTSFGKLNDRYLVLSKMRNDSMLNGYHLYFYESWGEPVEVEYTSSLVLNGSQE